MAGQLQQSLTEYVRAETMAKAQHLTTERIVAISGIGQIERDLGRLQSASAKYREVAEMCRDVEDPFLLAHVLRHLADIERERGSYEQALGLASEVVEIYRQYEEKSPIGLANALRVYALAQESNGNSGEARNAWREAGGLYEVAGIESGVSECHERIKIQN